ncbi:MAG TPA: hypothetical protein VKB70_06900, partial [Gaiellaceae bacterium]|nr:hypothetical protein [Gaiellaceae bacterium]
AWVEVWFKGYGWIPFDPTPPAPGSARLPTLPGSKTPVGRSRPPASPIDAATAGRPAVAGKLKGQNGLIRARATSESNVPGPQAGGGWSRGWSVLTFLLALAAVVGSIVVAKTGSRVLRRVGRHPRRVAAACREELAGFLADQRIEIARSATIRELGELVRREFGAEPAPFVAAATAAGFAPEPHAAAAALAARRELRVLLHDVRRGLTRWERLRGLFSLRSLRRPRAVVDASASLGSVSVGS